VLSLLFTQKCWRHSYRQCATVDITTGSSAVIRRIITVLYCSIARHELDSSIQLPIERVNIAATLQNCIQDVLGSNFCRNADVLTNGFRDFLQSLQRNIGTTPQLSLSNNFPVHPSWNSDVLTNGFRDFLQSLQRNIGTTPQLSLLNHFPVHPS
jgi:hypothetical protein